MQNLWRREVKKNKVSSAVFLTGAVALMLASYLEDIYMMTFVVILFSMWAVIRILDKYNI